MKKIKRLFLDIETSYSIVVTFSLWPKHIPHNNILQEWYIICAAWKWEGKKRIYGATCEGRCDKKVTAALSKAIQEADEIVYHNGKKFDFKKLNTRVLLNGLPPMPKPRECDTLLQCRKHFGFTSNRLDYIGKQLNVGGKIETSNHLWLDVLNGSKTALKDMYKYNKRDVTLLEDVYQTLKPHIDIGYNANLNKLIGLGCPSCGGSNAHKHSWYVTKAGRYQRYRCQDCGKVFHSGKREKIITPVDR